MPKRMNPIAKYLFALSAMIVAWTAYAKVAVPFLEGPPSVVQRSQASHQYPDVAEILDKSHLPSIVPADAWELGSCKTLLTPQGTVYFEYWEPVDDSGTYQLMPFTIVINDPVNTIAETPATEPLQKPAPIVLRSLEGAKLKFTKPLTARSKKDDIEFESAQLDGQVTLFRPSDPDTGEEELRVVTSDVKISRSQVFTLSDVHFSVGAHHGSGRNLSIELAHRLGEDSPAKSFSSIEGVEQMELAFVSELVLQPSSTEDFARSRQRKSPAATPRVLSLSNQQTPLRLSCQGPFVFRMAEKKAWFRDKVVVTQLDRFQDNLRCDSLQIELDRDQKTDATSIRNLIAIGSPERPATITSRSRQTLVVGEELNFDVMESKIKAAGSTPVTIKSPRFAFEARDLEYELAEDGKLGVLFASGPGILKGISEKQQQTFEVRWDEVLKTRQAGDQQVRIDVAENARVSFDGRGSISADQLSLLVWQLPDPGLSHPQQDNPQKDNPKWQYQPAKLQTHGDVRIETDKIQGSANEMTVDWPASGPRTSITPRHTVSYRPEPFRQQQTGEFRSLPSQTPALKFQGDKIFASVDGDLNRMKILDLAVDGPLTLESHAKDRRPFRITGQTMQLVPQSGDLYRVTIEGREEQPATFRSPGLDLVGQNLQLDQSANTMWVRGKGHLDIDAATGRRDVGGKQNRAKLDKARVLWFGGMVFDGDKIYFEHDVELLANRQPSADGQRSNIKANSEALTIELTESIRFEKVDPDTDDGLATKEPEIQRMVFVNRVDPDRRAFKLASARQGGYGTARVVAFQNTTLDAAGDVVNAQQLIVPMATVDAMSGDMRAAGPGQALAYQYSNGKCGSGFAQRSQSGRKSNNPSAKRLNCVHTRFDGQLVANSENGTMEIDRNTRSAWSNVDRFDQTLDPDQPEKLPIGAAVLKSDVLKLARWTPRNSKTRMEMLAQGNTSIQSDLFEAVADRLSYADDTDVLVIEGNPPANAKLSYRRSLKSQPETLMANKVTYRLYDQRTEVIDVRSVEAGLPERK